MAYNSKTGLVSNVKNLFKKKVNKTASEGKPKTYQQVPDIITPTEANEGGGGDNVIIVKPTPKRSGGGGSNALIGTQTSNVNNPTPPASSPIYKIINKSSNTTSTTSTNSFSRDDDYMSGIPTTKKDQFRLNAQVTDYNKRAGEFDNTISLFNNAVAGKSSYSQSEMNVYNSLESKRQDLISEGNLLNRKQRESSSIIDTSEFGNLVSGQQQREAGYDNFFSKNFGKLEIGFGVSKAVEKEIALGIAKTPEFTVSELSRLQFNGIGKRQVTERPFETALAFSNVAIPLISPTANYLKSAKSVRGLTFESEGVSRSLVEVTPRGKSLLIKEGLAQPDYYYSAGKDLIKVNDVTLSKGFSQQIAKGLELAKTMTISETVPIGSKGGLNLYDFTGATLSKTGSKQGVNIFIGRGLQSGELGYTKGISYSQPKSMFQTPESFSFEGLSRGSAKGSNNAYNLYLQQAQLNKVAFGFETQQIGTNVLLMPKPTFTGGRNEEIKINTGLTGLNVGTTERNNNIFGGSSRSGLKGLDTNALKTGLGDLNALLPKQDSLTLSDTKQSQRMELAQDLGGLNSFSFGGLGGGFSGIIVPEGSWFQGTKRRKSKRAKQKKQYQPSLYANVFGVKGKTSTKTGLEIRGL